MTIPFRMCLVMIAVLVHPVAGLAESFAALYGGYAVTRDDGNPGVMTSRPLVSGDAKFDDAPVVGVRIGGWTEQRRYLGGALDFSWLELEGSSGFSGLDIRAYPISALLLGRLSLLTSDEHPNGALQPYLAAGPSLLVSKFRLKNAQTPAAIKDTAVDLGVDARLGATWFFAPGAGVFLEYRYTYHEPEYTGREQGVEAQIDPELATHRAQLGFTVTY